jgi:hypothetical protein
MQGASALVKTLTLTPEAALLLAQLLRLHMGALKRHFRRKFWRPFQHRVMAEDVHYARQMELVKHLLAQLELFDEEEPE